ncbi:MAG: DJ-1/PfpI family protein [Cyanobacteria bacterium P01_D01_bin.123]
MRIQIVIFNGFDELDAIAPYEVFANAAELGADLQVELVTLDSREEVTASHGLSLRPQGRLDLDTPADIVVIPGGGWNNRAEAGAWAESERGDLAKALIQLQQAGVTIAGVCTGGALLNAAGIIGDRAATTHHGAIAELQTAGVETPAARVVDEDKLITAGGVTSGLDLALWIVEKYWGAPLAIAVEEELEYQRRGTVWQRQSH